MSGHPKEQIMYYHQPEEYDQGEGAADYRKEAGHNEFDYYPTEKLVAVPK